MMQGRVTLMSPSGCTVNGYLVLFVSIGLVVTLRLHLRLTPTLCVWSGGTAHAFLCLICVLGCVRGDAKVDTNTA